MDWWGSVRRESERERERTRETQEERGQKERHREKMVSRASIPGRRHECNGANAIYTRAQAGTHAQTHTQAHTHTDRQTHAHSTYIFLQVTFPLRCLQRLTDPHNDPTRNQKNRREDTIETQFLLITRIGCASRHILKF